VTVNTRNDVRKPQQLDVDVYNGGLYLGRATTRDVRNDGAFILIREYPGESFQNDTLELHFIPTDKNQKPVCLNGTVVRTSNEGVDVHFNHSKSQFRPIFKTLCKTVGVDGENEKLLEQRLSSLCSM
jgi:hypothetical protein